LEGCKGPWLGPQGGGYPKWLDPTSEKAAPSSGLDLDVKENKQKNRKEFLCLFLCGTESFFCFDF